MTTKQERQNLIDFIKKHDTFYEDKTFEYYSLTDLYILKTHIEVIIEKQRSNRNKL